MSRAQCAKQLIRGLTRASNPSAVPVSYAKHFAAELGVSQNSSTQALWSRPFSASSAVQNSLTQILKDELKYENENYQKPEEIAAGPPAPFKLTETPGDTLITLTRTFKDEEVTVDLHVNNQPAADEETSSVVFNVAVTKGDKSLVFECESDGTEVTINHVSYEPKGGIEQESVFTGPVFEELDESLKSHFLKYLEERGVTADLGEYLRFLIYDKEQREYAAWLKNVHDFVSK